MARVAFAVRVEEELRGWVRGYARSRNVSEGTIAEAALLAFRELTYGGVPDLPSERRGRMAPRSSAPAAVPAPSPAPPAADAEGILESAGVSEASGLVRAGRSRRLDKFVASLGQAGPVAPVDLAYARRRIAAGCVEVDGRVVRDPELVVALESVVRWR